MILFKELSPPLLLGLVLVLTSQCNAVVFCQSPELGGWAASKLADNVLANNGMGKSYSIDFARYQNSLVDLPIGVFDSGVGGLTVLETLLNYDQHNNLSGQPGADFVPDFQNERFIYLGDQANMPYGNYSAAGKEDYLRELIMKDAIFLLGSRYWPNARAAEPSFDKPPVKAIVIACNTATAYGLDDIRDAIKRWNLPVMVVGVVEAGAASFVQELSIDAPPCAVAVMATSGTCSSGAYPKAIKRAAGLAGKRNPVVWQQGSVGLAGAIEGNSAFLSSALVNVENGQIKPKSSISATYLGPAVDNVRAPIDADLSDAYGFEPEGLLGDLKRPESWQLNSVENYVRYDVVTLVEGYRRSGATQPLEKIILGCTHFPYEADRIWQCFSRLRDFRTSAGEQPYRKLIAPQVTLIDPGLLTARQLYRQLFGQRLLVKGEPLRQPFVERVFISVPAPSVFDSERTPDGGLSSQYKYGRVAGQAEREDTRFVSLTESQLPEVLIDLLKSHCPNIWAVIARPTGASSP